MTYAIVVLGVCIALAVAIEYSRRNRKYGEAAAGGRLLAMWPMCSCSKPDHAKHAVVLINDPRETTQPWEAAFLRLYEGKAMCFECGGKVLDDQKHLAECTAAHEATERLRELGIV